MTRIETIAIGDELLDGRITDRNASLLARALTGRGLAVRRMSVVADDPDEIVEALESALSGAEVVVCSGGLGPTDDDRTRQAVAQWQGVHLELNQDALDRIAARFKSVGFEMTPNNRQQAMFPDGARILETEVGTAAGFSVSAANGRMAFFLPGVPQEYQWFVERYVLPEIAGRGEFARKTLVFFGLGESLLEDRLGAADLPEGVRVGYRAHFPEIHVTLSSVGHGAGDRVRRATDTVLGRLGRFLVAEDEETLPARLGRLLAARGATLTTAESCTGGLIAALVTDVPGSSAYFRRGIVTYSDEAKVDLVGVRRETLARWGAVSEAVAREMAAGARAAAQADFGLAVSGVAGPSGGSPDKPVGTVDIALDTPDESVALRLVMRPTWGRERIRQASAHQALSLLLKALEGRLTDDPRAKLVPHPTSAVDAKS